MSKWRYREHNDLGVAKTLSWLAGEFGETDDVSVEKVSVECPAISELTCSDLQLLDRLQSRNQSALHSYLKFAAWKWMQRESAFPETIETEVICYCPDEELCEDVTIRDIDGQPYDIHNSQILYNNEECFPVSYGMTIRIDLYALDMNVEVGGTQPANLLIPLLEGFAEAALWLPFPWEKTPLDFARNPATFRTANAYRIKLR